MGVRVLEKDLRESFEFISTLILCVTAICDVMAWKKTPSLC